SGDRSRRAELDDAPVQDEQRLELEVDAGLVLAVGEIDLGRLVPLFGVDRGREVALRQVVHREVAVRPVVRLPAAIAGLELAKLDGDLVGRAAALANDGALDRSGR